MKTKLLPWDSSFLGLKTASIILDGNKSTENVLHEINSLKENKYRLLFLFSQTPISIGDKLATLHNHQQHSLALKPIEKVKTEATLLNLSLEVTTRPITRTHVKLQF